MFCPECGTKLPDNSRFCGACGTRLVDLNAAPQITPNDWNTTPPAQKPAPVPVPPQTPPPTPQPTPEPQSDPFYSPAPTPGPPKASERSKSKKSPMIAVAAVIVLAVILLVVFCVKLLFGAAGSGDNAYVCLTSTKFQLLNKLDGSDPVTIAASKGSDVSPSIVRFSEDGKYVYFLTKYDSSDDRPTGSLYRAEYGKLKADSSKNDKYITQIASNVSPYFDLVGNNCLLYQNDDDTLYYYNGTDSEQIAKKVRSFRLNENGQELVYCNYSDDEEDALYYTKLGDSSSTKKLASHVSNLVSSTDFDHLYYVRFNEDDYNYTLYTVGINKDPEKIAEISNYHSYGNGDFCFFAETGDTISPADYVTGTVKDTWIAEELNDRENAYPVYALYFCKDGVLTPIVENILNWGVYYNPRTDFGSDASASGLVIIYNTVDMITDTIDADDVDSVYDVYDLLDLDFEAENYIVTSYSSTPIRISEMAAASLAEFYEEHGCRIYATENNLIIHNCVDVAMIAPITDGVVRDFADEIDCAYIPSVNVADNTFYYFDHTDSNDFGDLYLYKSGSSEKIAYGIYAYQLLQYDDGSMLACTDLDWDDETMEMTMYDEKGGSTILADDVTCFIRPDKKNVLYISDGDLYCYNGKDRTMLASGVEFIWAKEELEPTHAWGMQFISSGG